MTSPAKRMACLGFPFTIMLSFVLVTAGCKSSPTDFSSPTPPELAGSYIGIGALVSNPGNVLMQLAGPDSAGDYSGSILYRAASVAFDDVYRSGEGDTLFCRFTRDGTTYRFWGYIETTGLLLHFNEPSGITAFRVNREASGYNLTGLWNGLMSSTTVPDAASAGMTMDQQGQLFWGTLDVNLPDNPDFEFSSGAMAGASFQLSGSAWVFTQQIPADFVGSFLAADTVQGVWQAGGDAVYDEGEFYFVRTFD